VSVPGVLDPISGAGVLALHPDRAGALLHIPGLVQNQHRLGVGEMVDHVPAQVLAHSVGVPARPRQQMLHPIRACLTGVLGDRPTVHPRLNRPGESGGSVS
jgi:hypothetical protein